MIDKWLKDNNKMTNKNRYILLTLLLLGSIYLTRECYIWVRDISNGVSNYVDSFFSDFRKREDDFYNARSSLRSEFNEKWNSFYAKRDWSFKDNHKKFNNPDMDSEEVLSLINSIENTTLDYERKYNVLKDRLIAKIDKIRAKNSDKENIIVNPDNGK